MELSTTPNSLTISGNIKSISDFQSIQTKLDSIINNEKTISVNIVDSISIISSVIGYFNKLVLKDKIDLQINVGSDELLDLLDDLNLTDTFKVKKFSLKRI
jgi:hypothetical protein